MQPSGSAAENVSGTLNTYEQSIDAYIRDSARTPGHEDFLARVLELLPRGAHMLELGTGPGHDALFLRGRRRGRQAHRRRNRLRRAAAR
jgi:hypothetical protein